MIQTSSKVPLFFGVVFFFIVYLLWLMAKEILGPIIFGAILAGIFFPLNQYLREKLKNNKNIAASATCLLIFLIVLLPLLFLALNVSKEAVDLYQIMAKAFEQESINHFLFGEGLVPKTIKYFSTSFHIDINLTLIKEKILIAIRETSGTLLIMINSFVGNFLSFLLDLTIMMIVTFGLLVKGDLLKNYIFNLSPLPSDQEQIILSKFNQMNYVTLVCNGIGGIIQGVLAGISFWVVGVESVFLWTVVMILLAFIPLIGISLITIPTSFYFILTGHPVTGIALIIFTSLVGLIVENWFKPKFIGKKIQIDSTFVLLTIIGGMAIFGMAGIFYGPVIGILFLTIVEIYHENYKIS